MEPREVACPWCEKGIVFVKGAGKVEVTVRCSKCQHFFKVDLLTRTVTKTKAYKRYTGKPPSKIEIKPRITD